MVCLHCRTRVDSAQNRILSCTYTLVHAHTHAPMSMHTPTCTCMHTFICTRGIRAADTQSVTSLSHYTSTIQCGVYILRTKNRKCNVTELEAMVRKNMTLFNSQASGVDVQSYCSGRNPWGCQQRTVSVGSFFSLHIRSNFSILETLVLLVHAGFFFVFP